MIDVRFGTPDPPFEAEGPRRVEVPPQRYTSTEFLELERAHLWPGVWLVAGFARDVESPGDWFVFEIGQDAILVVRGEDGEIRAFHNVCLHRGHPLRDPGCGSARSFVCPYHNWEWGLDGALKRVPNRSRFRQGFPDERRRLASVACEVFAGLVWICMSEPKQSLADYLGPIHEHVGRYDAADFRINADWTADWACNWKTAIDGFNETYHGPATHPQFAEFLDTLSAEFSFGARHSVFVIEHGVRPPEAGSDEILEPIAGMLRQAGADPRALAGKPAEARAIVQRWVREQSKAAGRDVSRLSDAQLTDTFHFYVFPNVHIDFHGANDFTIQRFRPHPTEPGRSFLDVFDLKCLPGEFEATRPKHVEVPAGAEQRSLVYTQDIARLARLQKGLASRGFPGAHLSQMERRIYHMHLVIDEYLGDAAPPSLRARVGLPRAQPIPASDGDALERR